LVGHSAGGHIGLLYGYKYSSEKIKIATCISLAGPTDFTDDVGWSAMTTWGDNLETRLLCLSQIGSKLTGHKIELTQANWTRQKTFFIFKKYIMEISPIMYVSGTKKTPPTLLVHARSDNQVPYSNSSRLMNALDCVSTPHKLITPTGCGNNHLLGGKVCASDSPIVFTGQAWENEVKDWINAYL